MKRSLLQKTLFSLCKRLLDDLCSLGLEANSFWTEQETGTTRQATKAHNEAGNIAGTDDARGRRRSAFLTIKHARAAGGGGGRGGREEAARPLPPITS